MKSLSKKTTQVISISFLLTLSTTLNAAECSDVYANATRNIMSNDRESSELSYFFNKICSRSGEVASSAYGLSLEAVVKAIPFKFSADSSSSTQKATEFCKAGAGLHEMWEKQSYYSSTIVTAALVSYNECRALETQGLRITHQVQEPTSLIIYGKRLDAITNVSIDAANFSNMKCRSASFSKSGKTEPFNGLRKLTVPPSGFNIACTRSTATGGGKQVYPRASVGIGTSIGSYTVVLPDEELDGFDLASQNQAKYNSLQQQKDQQVAELTAKVNEGKARLENVSAKPYAFYTADGPVWNNLPWSGGAINQQAFANSLCASGGDGATPVLQRLDDRSGGSHGIQTYAMACIRK